MRTWIIAIAICATCGAGCSASVPLRHQESRIDRRITSTGWITFATTEHFQGNGFIKSVSLTDSAIMEIRFLREMEPETLGPGTVVDRPLTREPQSNMTLIPRPFTRERAVCWQLLPRCCSRSVRFMR